MENIDKAIELAYKVVNECELNECAIPVNKLKLYLAYKEEICALLLNQQESLEETLKKHRACAPSNVRRLQLLYASEVLEFIISGCLGLKYSKTSFA